MVNLVLKDITELPRKHTWLFLLLFISVLSPGILIVYQYKPDLFIKIESLKLILFSIAISCPVSILNLLISVSIIEKADGIKEGITSGDSVILSAFCSLLITGFVFYPSIISSYIFELRFLHLIALITALEIIILILAYAIKKEIERGAKLL